MGCKVLAPKSLGGLRENGKAPTQINILEEME